MQVVNGFGERNWYGGSCGREKNSGLLGVESTRSDVSLQAGSGSFVSCSQESRPPNQLSVGSSQFS